MLWHAEKVVFRSQVPGGLQAEKLPESKALLHFFLNNSGFFVQMI